MQFNKTEDGLLIQLLRGQYFSSNWFVAISYQLAIAMLFRYTIHKKVPDVKSSEAKGKKRKSDSSIEKEHASVEKHVKIRILLALKKQLVDDWEFVNHQDKLVKLPRFPNLQQKFLDFLKCMQKNQTSFFFSSYEGSKVSARGKMV